MPLDLSFFSAMLMQATLWVSLGAGLRAHLSSSTFALRRTVALLAVLTLCPTASAVTCQTCRDSIVGCAGGAECPLLKEVVDNTATMSCGLQHFV